MIEYQCPNCNTVLQIPGQFAGMAGTCKQCGSIIQVPEESSKPKVQEKPPEPEKDRFGRTDKEKVRFRITLGAMLAVLALLAAVSLYVGDSGTPLGLAIFAINFLFAVLVGFFFFVGLHTPEILSHWLGVPFYRWSDALLFIPTSAASFFLAWYTYSP